MIRLLTVWTVVGAVLAGSAGLVQAQSAKQAAEQVSAPTSSPADTTVRRSGRVTLTDWPASLSRLLDEMGTQAPYLLPAVDTLDLDYRYAAGDSTSQWSFVLGWRPGANVLYRGDILPRKDAPSDLRMANVELRARVRAGGEYVGDMIVAVDSMRLAPLPSIYPFEVTVGHDRVFLDTDADTARTALLQGATLDRMVVERIGFVGDKTSTSGRRQSPNGRKRRRDEPSSPSIFEPNTTIIFGGWIGGGRERSRGDSGSDHTDEDQQRDEGRSASSADRTTTDRDRRERSSEDDEDADEEDADTSLRLPALGAAAAVGLVAVVGGTVGLYGNAETPLGLAAGYTQPNGGIQLQTAVNTAVLEDAPNQKLTVKAMGFYDVFGAPVQPAAGLGAQADPSDVRTVTPVLSIGLAVNTSPIVLIGGLDVVHQAPELGLTYNFR